MIPDLSPAELERLALLMEEMGEAHQAIGKILRHGYESRHPDGGPTNREMLEKELGHVSTSLSLMISAQDVDVLAIARHNDEKHKNVKKYLHHQVPA
jgi:NTP pyrophosphatase (non-canonical NTP hydrolase)